MLTTRVIREGLNYSTDFPPVRSIFCCYNIHETRVFKKSRSLLGWLFWRLGSARVWRHLIRAFLLLPNMAEASHGQSKCASLGPSFSYKFHQEDLYTQTYLILITSQSPLPPPNNINIGIWGLNFQHLDFWGEHIQTLVPPFSQLAMSCVPFSSWHPLLLYFWDK
jgi:hypothetical protein